MLCGINYNDKTEDFAQKKSSLQNVRLHVV